MIYNLNKKSEIKNEGLNEVLKEFKNILSEIILSNLNKNSVRSIDNSNFNNFNESININSKTYILSFEEQLILLLSLAPHLQPNLFDEIIKDAMPHGGDFPEFGGMRGANHRGMLPTGETAQFILAGNDIEKRIEVHKYFSQQHFFHENGILWLEQLKEGEPIMSGRIIIAPEWVEYFLTGKMPGPTFSPDFPAKLLTTKMEWTDLVLHLNTFDLLDDIKCWLEHQDKLYADKRLSPKIKPGYRVLFYGPPGTGKTLTVSLLGNEFNKEVYRIDLSMIVSKYIGETEKNLNKVFDKAMNKDWILFFDEADALFSKRTNVQSAHDKFANQEVSYLLQRVEDFEGLLILASNFKNNIDEAFLRRFNTIVHFPKPNASERLRLWKNCVPDQLSLDDNVNFDHLSSKYELTGAMIVNIMQYATIRTFAAKQNKISLQTILEGIRKEFHKEEKSMY